MYNKIPKPTIKPSKTFMQPKTAATVRKNMEWLKQHYQEYQGQWVALKEGVLVAANESLRELHRTLKNSEESNSTVLMNLKLEL